jgi:hypothetical protein
MPVSRSEFLKTGVLALIGIRSGADVFASAPGVEPTIGISSVSRFRPHLNSTFRVTAPDGRDTTLTLAKVVEPVPSGKVEQFLIVLNGPAAEPLADGTYRFEHAVLGWMDLFINKVGLEDLRRARYQACFGYVRT